MKSIVKVAIAFDVETTNDKKSYDIWEHVIIDNWPDHRTACDGAFAISRKIFDNISNIKLLGYLNKPLIYAMVSVDTDIELRFDPHLEINITAFITKVATLNEHDFQKLCSYNDISLKYRLGYIFPSMVA